MREFSYKETLNDEQNILVARKKKINRQKVVFITIFWCLIAVTSYYIYYNIRWVRFDGFMKTDNQQIALVDDVFLVDINVSVGDTVRAGDVLFTFMMTRGLMESFNLNAFTGVEKEYLTSSKAIAEYENNLRSVEEQIVKIRTQVEQLRKQIFVGVSTEPEMNRLEDELLRLEAQKTLLGRNLVLEREHLALVFGKRDLAQHTRPPSSYSLHELKDMLVEKQMLYPYVAKFDGIVTDISKPVSVYCYKGDAVLEIQPLDYSLLNLHVMTIVRLSQLKYLKEGDDVEVLLGDNIHHGTVELIGYAASEIPDHLRQPFEKNATALSARIHFNPGESLTFWEITNGLQVEVRKRRF